MVTAVCSGKAAFATRLPSCYVNSGRKLDLPHFRCRLSELDDPKQLRHVLF